MGTNPSAPDVQAVQEQIAILQKNEQALVRRQEEARRGQSVWTSGSARNLRGIQKKLARLRSTS